ncbi:Sacsin [Camellia lanceoleosa]|uniref:Sacsin n=1 Tax=Camellia lanceoleosa TaxID=1840588 RepID=A0ACC0HX36_9ERIC|nr:Sacsin [Camellia lanceoleosa]
MMGAFAVESSPLGGRSIESNQRLRWLEAEQLRGEEREVSSSEAFCFLHLLVRTGLTVEVNGYFEVSSNRHGIWYGADMDRSGKIRSLWNRLLLEEVMAPSFRLRGWEGVLIDVVIAAVAGS